MLIAQWKWKVVCFVTLSGFRETMCAIYELLITNSSLVWKKTSVGTIWCKKDDENTYSYRSILCFFRIHFLFFLCPVDLSFALLYFDYHVIISFFIIPKRVLIGCYFWAWKTLVEWKKDQKQRTGKPPFESESSHLTASRVRVGSSGSSFFAAVVCCIMKVREMWIHLLELYVSISLLVRLISILSLGWEIRWLNLTTSRNVSVRFKLFCKLCCFTNISTRGPTKPKYLKITVVKINFDMVHISTSYILWRVQVDKETVVRRWESTTTRSFAV